jgi:hypothetical protein
MAKIKNVSPFGDLDVPSLGIIVKLGESVDVSDEAAASLLEQPIHWAAGDSAPVAQPTPEAPDAPVAPAN